MFYILYVSSTLTSIYKVENFKPLKKEGTQCYVLNTLALAWSNSLEARLDGELNVEIAGSKIPIIIKFSKESSMMLIQLS